MNKIFLICCFSGLLLSLNACGHKPDLRMPEIKVRAPEPVESINAEPVAEMTQRPIVGQ